MQPVIHYLSSRLCSHNVITVDFRSLFKTRLSSLFWIFLTTLPSFVLFFAALTNQGDLKTIPNEYFFNDYEGTEINFGMSLSYFLLSFCAKQWSFFTQFSNFLLVPDFIMNSLIENAKTAGDGKRLLFMEEFGSILARCSQSSYVHGQVEWERRIRMLFKLCFCIPFTAIVTIVRFQFKVLKRQT